MKRSLYLKIFIVLLTAFGIVYVASRERETTPRRLMEYLTTFSHNSPVVAKPTGKPPPTVRYSTNTHSLKGAVKKTLFYNGTYFDVYVDPEAELSQETVKRLYEYYLRVQETENR